MTRFSIRAQPHPPGHPVCLRLLSAADIVKIIGNTFFLDGDLKAETLPTAERIDAVLARARVGRRDRVRRALSDEDVWDIQEYFEQQFAGAPYLDALASFWDEASALAPKLDGDGPDRAVQPALGRPRALFLPVPDPARRARAAGPRRPRPSVRSTR